MEEKKTLKELVREIYAYLVREIKPGRELEENFEWYCEEYNLNPNHKPSRQQYAKFIMEAFVENMKGIAKDFQYDFEETKDDIISYDEDDDINEFIAKELSETLDNPFFNTYNYEWEPIVMALDNIGIQETSALHNIRANVGQKILLAFYIQGNDGPLSWAYILDAIS